MGFFNKKLSSEDFPKEITISDKVYNLEVIFSKKKSSSVNIISNKLVFRMSSYLSQTQAQKHFKDLLVRISNKIEKSSNLSTEKTIGEVLEQGHFEFNGETYYLEHTKTRGVKLSENTFLINFHTKLPLLEKHIIKLLLERYKDRLRNYVYELNLETYDFNIKDFELKNLNSKWGHCTHDNIILLNLKLLNASKEILDYVIYHELSHIKHKNHSSRFWDEVSRFCPNYKRHRKFLKENPPVLFK